MPRAYTLIRVPVPDDPCSCYECLIQAAECPYSKKEYRAKLDIDGYRPGPRCPVHHVHHGPDVALAHSVLESAMAHTGLTQNDIAIIRLRLDAAMKP